MTNRGFTEAVPLSLSSMAHMTLPLEEGVLDGLKQVLQHTLLSCVNYARAIHPPHVWTFRDLTTSQFAWEGNSVGSGDASGADAAAAAAAAAASEELPPRDLPASLTKLGFKHQYPRNCFIYLKQGLPEGLTKEQELEHIQKGWTHQPGILGRVSLLYATQQLMTPGELSGKEVDEDTPPCVLYKVLVEYRSLPATGSKSAVQAEELSMLSFGGSVDDDVKYGALASLYDDHAKYVLEIYSVRGKKYKFDLMDATLSDGTVPRLPSKPAAGTNNKNGTSDNGTGSKVSSDSPENRSDPFVKSLCVTVTDHACTSKQEDQQYAVTRIHLTMEGNLRSSLEKLPRFDYVSTKLQETFLSLNHAPPEMATASPSGHTLLLDPREAGKVYINGRYVTTWGTDPRIGSHFPALFGMDMHSIPYWHGRIFDYEVLKRQYAQMWQDILIDARLMPMNIGGRLLYRLMTGSDPVKEDEDDDENNENAPEVVEPMDTGIDCLESQVIQSGKFDPVGISAKALGTKFKMEFGEDGYPCLPHEIDWVKDRLPGRTPVACPLRVINVLRRGGYFNVKRLSDEIWFAESRKAKEGEEATLVQNAVKMLEESGCSDVTAEHVVIFSGVGVSDPVRLKGLVRFNRSMRQYHVNEHFLNMDIASIVKNGKESEDEGDKKMAATPSAEGESQDRAFLLGLHIAQEHPDGNVLIRYLLRNRRK